MQRHDLTCTLSVKVGMSTVAQRTVGKSPATRRMRGVDQVTGSVRWRESVQVMAAKGVTEFWEIGSGKALSGMIRKIERSLTSRQFGTPEAVAAVKES